MDTQSNLPFQLRFRHGKDEWTDVTQFRRNGGLTEFDPAATFVENVELKVRFDAPDPEARLYMDGLEMLSEKVVEIDEMKTAYLVPSKEPYVLFSYTDEYYPHIPGFYRVTVITEGHTYHTVVQVVPSRITREQWEVMRDELEQEVRGLAQDIVRKNLGLGGMLEQFIPAEQMQRLLVIRHHFPAVMAALMDLMDKVHYRVRKEYRVLPVERVKAIDEVTVRHRLTHPDYVETLKAPVRDIEYDLPENQWVRRIVSVVSQYLDDITESIDVYHSRVEMQLNEQLHFVRTDRDEHLDEPAFIREKRLVLSELLEFRELARKMKHSMQLITHAHWFSKISHLRSRTVPHVLMHDSRYRALYQLYRDLNGDDVQIALDTAFAYQWKRTDLLYEIWGFLKICQFFTHDLDFSAKSGWIYDSAAMKSERLFVPVLPEGTTIVMERGDIRVHLVYNCTVPSHASDTDLQQQPMYMPGHFHNRPDARIDVFQKDIYCGTVIIDFKYRQKGGFWIPNPKLPKRRPQATNQLISYYIDSASPWLFGDKIKANIREQLRPVLEVWALYPRNAKYGGKDQVDYDETHHVRLLHLSPGEMNMHIPTQLQEGIARVLKFAEDYI